MARRDATGDGNFGLVSGPSPVVAPRANVLVQPQPAEAEVNTGPDTMFAQIRTALQVDTALLDTWKVPARLRAFVRGDEVWLVVLAALIGIAAALLVAAMVGTIQLLHHTLFAIDSYEVSGAPSVDPMRAFLVPTIGGLILGVFSLLLLKRGRGPIIDPIEANALYGGRIRFRESLIVVAQTMISNGFGGSIGMEAGYTQIGAAIASKLGTLFHLRRSDMRTLVGCGAAGAIAAAFDAPLTGAFYAFELIIATYSIATLAPVVVASISAVATIRLILPPPSFQVGFAGNLSGADYTLVITMGLLCAFLGIAMMWTVTLVENLFRKSRLPIWMRPTVGGAAVGLLALITPTVLSSGHSALHVGFGAYYSASFLALIIGLKALASAISIGSGFRGGLFFASLFLGAMLGKLVAIGWMLMFGLQIPGVVIGIVGMSAMATAVLGGPLTMSFLALESTGSLPLTTAVLAASVIASLTVRKVFGYSFATWRFHLRGESIRSAADIGWIRDLNVGKIMRRDIRTARLDTTIDQFRRDFPLGATQRVVVVDQAERYAGIVQVPEAHRATGDDVKLADLLHYRDTVLAPMMNVREAMKAFSRSESDALAVVDNIEARKVIGLLTEQHALRRYTEELDLRTKETVGV